jgi:radical SAM superfamily enzyme YgiQ (UPF0313 family)
MTGPEMAGEAVGRLTRTGFFPVISIILGLPGEEPSDVADTLRLVKGFEGQELVVFPVFYEPILEEDIFATGNFSIKNMRADHLELYRTCYEINFRRVPRLMWTMIVPGGILLKRMTLHVMAWPEIATGGRHPQDALKMHQYRKRLLWHNGGSMNQFVLHQYTTFIPPRKRVRPP